MHVGVIHKFMCLCLSAHCFSLEVGEPLGAENKEPLPPALHTTALLHEEALLVHERAGILLGWGEGRGGEREGGGIWEGRRKRGIKEGKEEKGDETEGEEREGGEGEGRDEDREERGKYTRDIVGGIKGEGKRERREGRMDDIGRRKRGRREGMKRGREGGREG